MNVLMLHCSLSVAEGVREHDGERELKPDTTSVKPTAEEEEEEEMVSKDS